MRSNNESNNYDSKRDVDGSVGRTSIGSNGQKKDQLQSKMKNMFSKYVLGKEQRIDSQSYKDDAVWEKVI